MPIIPCYVDDRTMDALLLASLATGRAVDELAESAIAEAAMRNQTAHHGVQTLLDMGGVSIGLIEQPDGSIKVVP